MTNFRQPKYRYRFGFYSLLITLFLSACGDRSMRDLKKELAKIEARENPHVDAMPDIKQINPYFYEVQHLRDPFIPLKDNTQGPNPINIPKTTTRGKDGKEPCPTPDSNRVRVGIELMPLDALQMVGTLEANKTLWALVISKSEGTIYHVKQGDYMGQYYGKIINVSETEIDVLEQIPDGEGCWKDKISTIQLLDG
ncbi:MAG: hypothetical protein DRR16_30525 [Candidatus Parabeggiatoa sp. nov. 3]|nr:MAG: hypothetical protein DRR00_03350 [Gammaproteobacteria bacterium]RKZ67687.1 MAG: hypothetical protein DRQ99_05910 [Gammaproteobacteria bacterium]RKZ76308.1 MAG: hypothetical protein DRR16_30525 [Gammaproteobacteria bacterium]HEW98179.1 hypothetical protein [Beggiatoa sp.]